jgi:outer membrane immunogenic protein
MNKLLGGVAAFVFLGAGAAFASDMPVKAPAYKVVAPAAVFNWTGWYGGVNYGTGVAQTHGTLTGSVGAWDRNDTGYSAGVQIGYNWQYHPNWVAGVEADINWLGIDRTDELWGNSAYQYGVETDWYGTIRGRLGYTSSPSLFYVTGGAAFVHVKNHFDGNGFSAPNSETASGWTAGWGIETMLGGNWSAKAEYIYIDAGDQSVFHPDVSAIPMQFENRFHVFRKGLNYRFGGPGTPASVLPAHNWTGFYAGLYGGVGLAQVEAVTTSLLGTVSPFDLFDTAFTGGVQAGYNWQFHPHWVAGVEADIGWLGVDQRVQRLLGSVVFGVESDWYATVRARLGRSTGPALLYVTGGVAFVDVTNRFDYIGGIAASNSEVATGWTFGGGIEAVLGNNWTAKTEYLLIDAGSQDVFNSLFGDTTRFDNRFHVFRFGLNYKFGDIGKGPVYAKY